MFLSFNGEDRGAQLKIKDSTFKHSSFCKGMIYYKKFKDMSTTEDTLFVNITAQFAQSQLGLDSNRLDPYIIVQDSEMVNLGFHEIVDRVTLKQNQTQVSPQI